MLLNNVPADKLHLFSPPGSPLGKLRAELKRLEAKSAALADARFALPPGSSRARVTSANAKWKRAAEARDRVAAQIAAMEVAP